MQAILVATALSLLAWTTQAAPNAGGEDWPRVSPESVGLDPSALEALDADFRSGAIPLVDSLLVFALWLARLRAALRA
jgi:hypothetical protein